MEQQDYNRANVVINYQPSSTTIVQVQNNFRGYNRFWTPAWYYRHPCAWHPHWIHYSYWWHRPTWRNTCAWFSGFLVGVAVDRVLPYRPFYYGTNIIYRDRIVYVNNVRYVTAEEFYHQARDLAHSVEITPPTVDTEQSADDWLVMGTFAVFMDDGETNAGLILQLAANGEGEFRGNMVDEFNEDEIRQIFGALDPETQRVALRFEDDDDLILECGLWNLTQESLPLLIHLDENETEMRTLIRLAEPEE
jgi:hypothetical protein